jgi:FKBP-type peptidyl-prolyl cis-trans isomerase SlyD
MSRVLSFHYELTDKNGKLIDSSKHAKPFQVLEGGHQIIPGLEEVLFKMNAGEKKRVEVPAEKAYGAVDEELRIKISRTQLPEGDIKPGTRFSGSADGHGPVFTVIKIEGGDVFLDGNHPLAGQDLVFDVEVTEIREATQEELQHGHAHGPDGHGHHH